MHKIVTVISLLLSIPSTSFLSQPTSSVLEDMSWSGQCQRATIYCTVLVSSLSLADTVQHPQRDETTSGSEPTSTTGPAAEPENQLVPISFTSVHKQKEWKQKSTLLVRKKKGDEEGSSIMRPSWEWEEEVEVINEAVSSRCLSLGELWDVQIDFSCSPGITLLSGCSDSRLSGLIA